MTKSELIRQIISQLTHDLEVLLAGARAAHEAATHEENQPDNKYDTLALEASYVAQGQANRAQEIRLAIETYRQLPMVTDSDHVRLGSLVIIEADDGARKTLFLGPVAGGLKIAGPESEIMIITPASPLGTELVGKSLGDVVEVVTGNGCTEYELVAVR